MGDRIEAMVEPGIEKQIEKGETLATWKGHIIRWLNLLARQIINDADSLDRY